MKCRPTTTHCYSVIHDHHGSLFPQTADLQVSHEKEKERLLARYHEDLEHVEKENLREKVTKYYDRNLATVTQKVGQTPQKLEYDVE